MLDNDFGLADFSAWEYEFFVLKVNNMRFYSDITSAMPINYLGDTLNSQGSNNDVFRLHPKALGIGEDIIIGGCCGQKCSVIDLSLLDQPVEIDCTTIGDGLYCGTISDGVDTIVFQGIKEIILPECMSVACA